MAQLGNTCFILILALNTICSVAMFIMQRILYTEYAFPNLTLTCMHLLFTSIGLVICDTAKVFKPKGLSAIQLILPVLVYTGFVVFTNLSVEKNTQGTHMLGQTMPIVWIIFIQHYFYERFFSKTIKITAGMVISGIFLSVCFDLKLDFYGLVFVVLGFLLSSLYQIWICVYSDSLQASPLQVLFYLMPMSSLILAIIIPFVQPMDQLFDLMMAMPPLESILLILSGIFAFVVNLSTYWILQKTSPISYSIYEPIKCCVVLIFGYSFFAIDSRFHEIHVFLKINGIMTAFEDNFSLWEEGPTFFSILGITATVAGIATYAYMKSKERSKVESLPDKSAHTRRKRIPIWTFAVRLCKHLTGSSIKRLVYDKNSNQTLQFT